MSEFFPRITRRKVAAAAMIVLVSAGATDVVTYEITQRDKVANLNDQVGELKQQLADEKAKNIDTAQLEINMHEQATRDAESFATRLNQPDYVVRDMTVLNGMVEVKDSDGNLRPAYSNAILLSFGPGVQYDKDGKFLQGSWLGVRGNDENGNIVITPIPFKSTDRFTPYDPEKPVLDNVGVYASASKGGPEIAIKSLYAFDITSNQVFQNPDGTFIQPGLSVSMK